MKAPVIPLLLPEPVDHVAVALSKIEDRINCAKTRAGRSMQDLKDLSVRARGKKPLRGTASLH